MLVKHSLDGKVTLFIVLADDIVIIGDDLGQIKQLKGHLVS